MEISTVTAKPLSKFIIGILILAFLFNVTECQVNHSPVWGKRRVMGVGSGVNNEANGFSMNQYGSGDEGTFPSYPADTCKALLEVQKVLQTQSLTLEKCLNLNNNLQSYNQNQIPRQK